MTAITPVEAAAGTPTMCRDCGATLAEPALCGACGALQPLPSLDHFARLGLAAAYGIDPATLERAYFAQQRRFHPDRFAARGSRQKALALAHATAINAAYETLGEPLARARYLLERAGQPLPGDDGRTVGDPALLMEAMAWREALAEAATAADMAALAERLAAALDDVRDRLSRAFDGGDLAAATRETLRLAYLDKLGAELKRKRGGAS